MKIACQGGKEQVRGGRKAGTFGPNPQMTNKERADRTDSLWTQGAFKHEAVNFYRLMYLRRSTTLVTGISLMVNAWAKYGLPRCSMVADGR